MRLTRLMVLRLAVLVLVLCAGVADAQVPMPFTTWHVEGKTVGKATRFELVISDHGGRKPRVRRVSLGSVPTTKRGTCKSGSRVVDNLTETVLQQSYRKLGLLLRAHVPERLEGAWPRSDGTGMDVLIARCARDTPEYAVFIHDRTRATLAIVFVADGAVITRATGYQAAPKRAASPFIHLGKTPHWIVP